MRLKSICLRTICFLLLFSSVKPLRAQHYLKGEIKDETNKPLANVKMILASTGYVYYSGSAGGFGLMSTRPRDSVMLSLDGYQTQTVLLDAARFVQVVLKPLLSSGSVQRNRLMSFTRNLKIDDKIRWSLGNETYSSLLENDFVGAKSFPETGFAISIDKASYSNIRRLIKTNTLVPPDAVRIEEMLNYFNFEYLAPPSGKVFGFQSFLTDCPWNPANQLFILKACAKKVDLSKVPPSNLVFLVDISGSMDMPKRLPLLKAAFKLMVNNLREKDTVSIVVYGGTVGVWLPPTSGINKTKILKSIDDLEPGGATAGESGIITAYELAKNTFIKGGNNRVILATDGDFNVGQTSEDQLVNTISKYRQFGIYLTCLGVGMGNYKDSKLEILAKKGNGNFAYLDDEKEAEKVLVKELTQTLYAVADDAYLTINFNPALVKDYRLIGFDNKVNAAVDSLSELEGGEVGSGHTLLAMMEVSPTLKGAAGGPVAELQLNYRLPSDSNRLSAKYSCEPVFRSFANLDKPYQFATAVVMLGSLLKESKYAKALNWNDLELLAAKSVDVNDPMQKEFLEIVEKAKKMYVKKKGFAPLRGRSKK
jgi:Ca-activated chloride channel family protein